MESVQARPARQIIRLTPSMANNWQDCPRRFAEDRRNINGPSGYSSKLAKGKAVHELLAHVNRHLVGGGAFPDCGDMIERFWNPSHFRTAREAFDASFESRIILSNYLDRLRERHLTVLGYECFVTSKPLRVNDRTSIILSGRIDVITEEQGGMIAAEDIKTGDVLPPRGVLSLDLSTTIYHLLARQIYPSAPSIAVTQVLPATGAQVTATLREDEIEVAKDQIKIMVGSMATDPVMTSANFPPVAGEYCSWCRHRSSCPLYATSANGEEAF